MTGRHARGRHSAAVADDWPIPLDDLWRDTGGIPRIVEPIPEAPRATRQAPPLLAARIPLGLALTADATGATWATPPGDFDAEILHTVRLGEIRTEPPTWGGRGVRL